MLKRRKIRTKLKLALTLLSAIVLLLAFSGFWGLYRYRQLGHAVSQLAAEIPIANDLNLLALSMCESNDRLSEIRSRSRGMIQASPLGDSLIDINEIRDWEQSRFEQAMVTFSIKLAGYEDMISAVKADSLLVDNAQQQMSLRDIHSSFGSLESYVNKPKLDVIRTGQIDDLLAKLVRQTDSHLTMIHSGMAEFSNDVKGQYRTWITMAWSCLVIALIIVGILLWSFHFMIVKPFTTLVEGSRLVARQQFDHRIDLGTGDELAELAEAMNDMTDRFQGALAKVNSYCTDLDRQVRERTREVVQNEQLASVGFLAAGVAHEINNPLAAIAWSAESLASRVGEIAMLSGEARVVDDELCGALQTNLRRIEDEAYRCKGITEKLLDFSRLSEVRRASTDIEELVTDVVAMVGTVGKFRCKTIRTHVDGPEGAICAEVNQQEIRQVVLNLVTNALESVDTDGAVDVYVGKTERCVSVIVEDNGCGMSQDVLNHLFEPFFTRRRDGTGTGLGLSITYRIVSQHGGSLAAKSGGEGCGSRMEMLLPISPEHIDNIGIGPNTLGPNNPSSNPNQARLDSNSPQELNHESVKAA